MKNKKLFLIPLVMSTEAANAAISNDAVKTALSNYCVPYSETAPSNNGYYQKYNKPVCGSVFEANYNPAKSNPKCDCSTNPNASHKTTYTDAGNYLIYDATTRRCEPTCPNRHKIKELTGCPTGTFQDKINKNTSKTPKYLACEKCTYPTNATWAADTGCDWKCNSGFTQIGSSLCCQNLPTNASWNSGASNCNAWSCNSGYTNRSGACCANKPANSSWETGCDWSCDSGYGKTRTCLEHPQECVTIFGKKVCLPNPLKCNKYSDYSCKACTGATYSTGGTMACTSCGEGVETCNNKTGDALTCKLGYYLDGNQCKACTSASTHAHYKEAGSCDWECDENYWKKGNKCYEKIVGYYMRIYTNSNGNIYNSTQHAISESFNDQRGTVNFNSIQFNWTDSGDYNNILPGFSRHETVTNYGYGASTDLTVTELEGAASGVQPVSYFYNSGTCTKTNCAVGGGTGCYNYKCSYTRKAD